METNKLIRLNRSLKKAIILLWKEKWDLSGWINQKMKCRAQSTRKINSEIGLAKWIMDLHFYFYFLNILRNLKMAK